MFKEEVIYLSIVSNNGVTTKYKLSNKTIKYIMRYAETTFHPPMRIVEHIESILSYHDTKLKDYKVYYDIDKNLISKEEHGKQLKKWFMQFERDIYLEIKKLNKVKKGSTLTK